jgi:lipopolysaccharide export system permease protein
MKLLDKYIIRQFLGTFFFAILLFSAVAIVIDITEKIDDFIEHQVPLKLVITQYYLNFLPWIDALLTPLFVFIAVIFFTSRLANQTELVAMLAGGISFYRLLIPYGISATLLAAGLFYANHYVVPKANMTRQAFELEYLQTNYKKINRTIQGQIRKDIYIYLENFNFEKYNGKTKIDSNLLIYRGGIHFSKSFLRNKYKRFK